MAHEKNVIVRASAPQADVTVYIGRFNPFHLGHAHVLGEAIRTSKLVIVLIGSSDQARTIKNPFIFAERERMIQSWLSSERPAGGAVRIASLRDYPQSDARWIGAVQDKVTELTTRYAIETNQILTKVRITGSDRDESTWYLNAFPQWGQMLLPAFRQDALTNVSATAVRKWMFEPSIALRDRHITDCLPPTTVEVIRQFQMTPEYVRLVDEYVINKRYHEAWSVAPYAPTFNTADAVVIQSGHILVVERGAYPGKGLWALPGGFLDQNERLRDCAIRELMEETGILLAEGKNAKKITRDILTGSIRDKELFDKPDRSLRGRTLTMAYLFRLDDTKPLAKVSGQNAPLHETGGVEEVETTRSFWIPISDALAKPWKWFEDHHSIVEWGADNADAR